MLYNLRKLLLLLFASVILSACEGPNGPDGEDGKAYIKITSSDGYLYLYTDDNPSIPVNAVAGRNYRTGVGTYLFAYESRFYTSATTYSYRQWLGRYSITINYGTEGGEGKIFWQEGDPGRNGTDKYFTLYCNFYGPYQQELGKEEPSLPEIGEMNTLKVRKGEFLFEVNYYLKEKGMKEEK